MTTVKETEAVNMRAKVGYVKGIVARKEKGENDVIRFQFQKIKQQKALLLKIFISYQVSFILLQKKIYIRKNKRKNIKGKKNPVDVKINKILEQGTHFTSMQVPVTIFIIKTFAKILGLSRERSLPAAERKLCSTRRKQSNGLLLVRIWSAFSF